MLLQSKEGLSPYLPMQAQPTAAYIYSLYSPALPTTFTQGREVPSHCTINDRALPLVRHQCGNFVIKVRVEFSS